MKFWIVVDHDSGEYSVHKVTIESTALNAIASEKEKGRNITYSTSDATDMDAAAREAETLNANYHYVKDVLNPN